MSFRVNFAIASLSPVSKALKAPSFSIRDAEEQEPTRSKAKDLGVDGLLDPRRAILIKCGNAILRSDEFRLLLSVVVLTKSTMAVFAGPSFQEGSGSAAAPGSLGLRMKWWHRRICRTSNCDDG